MLKQKYFHFYSVISFILHLLYLFNFIGNTYPIALFILICSQFLLFIFPGYINFMKINWYYEFILHWLPVFIIKYDFTNINYLYLSLLLYIIVFNKKICVIYADPIKYLND